MGCCEWLCAVFGTFATAEGFALLLSIVGGAAMLQWFIFPTIFALSAERDLKPADVVKVLVLSLAFGAWVVLLKVLL